MDSEFVLTLPDAGQLNLTRPADRDQAARWLGLRGCGWTETLVAPSWVYEGHVGGGIGWSLTRPQAMRVGASDRHLFYWNARGDLGGTYLSAFATLRLLGDPFFIELRALRLACIFVAAR